MIEPPDKAEFAEFYAGYVRLVPDGDILGVLGGQVAAVERRVSSFSPEREQHRYAAGKWSVRELVGHITDAERVFGFRAFCFSRADKNPLPGFDENDYLARSDYHSCALAELIAEFALVRSANLAVLRRLDDNAWRRIGTASGNPVSVRALAYIMAGHVTHHLNILDERYGNDARV